MPIGCDLWLRISISESDSAFHCVPPKLLVRDDYWLRSSEFNTRCLNDARRHQCLVLLTCPLFVFWEYFLLCSYHTASSASSSRGLVQLLTDLLSLVAHLLVLGCFLRSCSSWWESCKCRWVPWRCWLRLSFLNLAIFAISRLGASYFALRILKVLVSQRVKIDWIGCNLIFRLWNRRFTGLSFQNLDCWHRRNVEWPHQILCLSILLPALFLFPPCTPVKAKHNVILRYTWPMSLPCFKSTRWGVSTLRNGCQVSHAVTLQIGTVFLS